MHEPLLRPREAQSTRSQLATELLLILFAAAGTMILLRTVLVLLNVTDQVWIGRFVYGMTRPVTDVLELVPGSDRIVYGRLDVVDVTLLAVLVLFPLGLLATGDRRQSR